MTRLDPVVQELCTTAVFLLTVVLNNVSLPLSLSFSSSAVWMYGFTESPRKEASGSQQLV